MSTACGSPQGERGIRPMWTHVDRGEGVKNLIFLDVINGWPLNLEWSRKCFFDYQLKWKLYW